MTKYTTALEICKEDHDKNLLFVIIESLMKIGNIKVFSELRIIRDSCKADTRKLTQDVLQHMIPNLKKHSKINNL